MVPVEGCCTIEENGVEGTGGGVVGGYVEKVCLKGGEGGEEGGERLWAEDVDVLERS